MSKRSDNGTESPIQNMDSIDIIGRRKDGGVDLLIVVSSRLDSSPDHQRLLLDKIESYLEQLNTPEFQSEFAHPPAEKVNIIVACCESPHPVIQQLVEQCQLWVADNNARLQLRVDP